MGCESVPEPRPIVHHQLQTIVVVTNTIIIKEPPKQHVVVAPAPQPQRTHPKPQSAPPPCKKSPPVVVQHYVPVVRQGAYSPAPNITFVPSGQDYVFEQGLVGRYVYLPGGNGPLQNMVWVPGHTDVLEKMVPAPTYSGWYYTQPIPHGYYPR